jgi:hypothetical protein
MLQSWCVWVCLYPRHFDLVSSSVPGPGSGPSYLPSRPLFRAILVPGYTYNSLSWGKMSAIVHPLRLLSRVDGDITSLYHSFYFLEVGYGNSVEIILRVPQRQSTKSDDIESGIKFFISEIASEPFFVEAYGSFVLTVGDGSRYNAFWRGLDKQIFVAVSQVYLLSFSRDLFEKLFKVPNRDMHETLLTLCEVPVLPMSGMTYSLQISALRMKLNFSRVEFAEDIDINATALSIFTPRMLVGAWEAIILERKVLVTSANAAIVSPCCEFLRRLILPLTVINTYVPFLTYSLITALDSPLPYLVGANVHTVRESQINLSETVVIDLDNRDVYTPRYQYGKLEHGAPESIVSKLQKDLSLLMSSPLQSWLNRASSKSTSSLFGGFALHPVPQGPLSEEYVNTMVDTILQLFISTNLSILSARASSNVGQASVPSFFRRQYHGTTKREPSSRMQSDHHGPMGFAVANDMGSGTMQLLRKRFANDTVVHFLPCWAELDDHTFAIYEQADETPIFCALNKDIRSVAPSAMEPEGHVFEVVFASRTFRFASTDPDSRRLWMNFIEEKMRNSELRENNAQSGVNSPASTQVSPVVCPACKRETSVRDSMTGSTPVNGSTQSAGQNTSAMSPSCCDGYVDPSDPMTKLFGTSADKLNSTEEEQIISKFRLQVKRTQMFSYMHTRIECGLYEPMMLKLLGPSVDLTTITKDVHVESYLWEGSSVQGLLDRIKTAHLATVPEDPEPANEEEEPPVDRSPPSSSMLVDTATGSVASSTTNNLNVDAAGVATPTASTVGSPVRRTSKGSYVIEEPYRDDFNSEFNTVSAGTPTSLPGISVNSNNNSSSIASNRTASASTAGSQSKDASKSKSSGSRSSFFGGMLRSLSLKKPSDVS